MKKLNIYQMKTEEEVDTESTLFRNFQVNIQRNMMAYGITMHIIFLLLFSLKALNNK